jgi:hypothetical protein
MMKALLLSNKVPDHLSPAFGIMFLGIGAEGGTRTPTSYLTRPSNVRVYQFRHFGKFGKDLEFRVSGFEFRVKNITWILVARCFFTNRSESRATRLKSNHSELTSLAT